MSTILIATLGKSPIVVTALVKALVTQKAIPLPIEEVHVIHPENPWVKKGYRLIEEYLLETYEIPANSCSLPFEDPNTPEDCLTFLQKLGDILENYEYRSQDVYLSLAGGRKNMSALMAVMGQFYACVKGLYHLLDRQEESRTNFYPIKTLVDMPKEQWREKMGPPAEDLNLISIPYYRFADPVALRKYFSAKERNEDFAVQFNIEEIADEFYSNIFQKKQKEPLLDLYLSQTAHNKYLELYKMDTNTTNNFRDCFNEMRYPGVLTGQGRLHGTFPSKEGPSFHFYKKRRTVERPFYYRETSRVIVAELTSHQDKSYEELSARLDQGFKPSIQDYRPDKSLFQLESKDNILLTTLGKSPLVVTQTYLLLRKEGVNIQKVAVVYPEKGGGVFENILGWLKSFFDKEKVEMIRYPVPGFADTDSREACEKFLEVMVQAIDNLRDNHPDWRIHLSLSGGRKGMSALALFSAQRSGIPLVYHTLVKDEALEERLEGEGSYEYLSGLSPGERRKHLRLEPYDREQMILFEIPVIPLQFYKETNTDSSNRRI
jgi:CRISPR-associated Csx14 family protein